MNNNYSTTVARLMAGLLFVLIVLGLATPAAATTVATPELRTTAQGWQDGVRARGGSAQLSGIVGDARHAASGGYHISRDDIRAAIGYDYSTTYPADRRGPGNAASAIDMTMSRAWMIQTTRRVLAAARANDPRLHGVRAFNGTLDGRNGVRIEVFDRGAIYWATQDHTWHAHVEFFRQFSRDAAAQRNFLSVVFATGRPAVKRPGISEQAILRLPVTHAAVVVLQRTLNATVRGTHLRVDGVGGGETLQALRVFQQRNHLPRSARVTRGTWIKLSVAYNRARR